MDAKITKQRLGNLLSYDWLKILVTIAAAVVAIVVLFTMIGARPSAEQKFIVHTFGGLNTGGDLLPFNDKLETMFSYDILEANEEDFPDSSDGQMLFQTRRSVLEGTVMIVADYTASEEEGAVTPFAHLISDFALEYPGSTEEHCGLFYYIDEYLASCEAYFARFFGENWETNDVPDAAKVREYFLSRNGKDRRFRSAAKKEEGVRLETERLQKLREDYLFVRDNGFGAGKLSVVEYRSSYTSVDPATGEEREYGYTHAVGIGLGKLSTLTKLYSYQKDGRAAVDDLVLLIYNNREHSEDNKYEVLTLLRYFLETYA